LQGFENFNEIHGIRLECYFNREKRKALYDGLHCLRSIAASTRWAFGMGTSSMHAPKHCMVITGTTKAEEVLSLHSSAFLFVFVRSLVLRSYSNPRTHPGRIQTLLPLQSKYNLKFNFEFLLSCLLNS
jgi:hypothetical protein